MAMTTTVSPYKGRRPRTAAQAWMILREAINAGSKKSKVKKVRFSWSAPAEHDTPSSYFEPLGDIPDKETLWYQPTDFVHFRKQAAIDAKDIKVNMSALVDCVVNAYGAACKTASQTKNEATLSKSLESIDADVRLTFWGHGGHNRGIEKCLRHTIIRKNGLKARTSYTAIAVTSQLKCDAEELRQKCESHSRQDRIFARMLGEADACIAWRSAVHVCNPSKLVEMECDQQSDAPMHVEFNTLRDDTGLLRYQLFPRQA